MFPQSIVYISCCKCSIQFKVNHQNKRVLKTNILVLFVVTWLIAKYKNVHIDEEKNKK